MAKKEFVVFGLGRFGMSVARTLAENGCQVLAVDQSQSKVEEIADDVTYAVCTNVTDAEAMSTLGISNFDGAVVAIGENMEASIMVTILAKEMGIPFVLAKAQSDIHAKVLKKVGADTVVFPEKETGMRIAHNLISGNFFDAIELSAKYSLLEYPLPEEWIGESLRSLNLRAKKKVNVIGIKRRGELDIAPEADMLLEKDDIMILVGKNLALSKITGENKL